MTFLDKTDKKNTFLALLGVLLMTAGVPFRPIMFAAVIFCGFAVIFINNPKTVICLMFTWLSFSTIFKFAMGDTSIYTYLQFIVILKFLIMKRKVDTRFFLYWFLLAAYVLIGGIGSLRDSIKFAIIPLMIYVFARETDGKDISRISYYYLLGVFTSTIVSFFRNYISNMSTFVGLKYVNLTFTSSGWQRADRLGALWGDPNYYSVHLILAIAILIVWYSQERIKLPLFIVGYSALAVFGGLTGSKSFLIMFAILTVLIVYTVFKNKKYVLGAFFLLLIFIAGMLLLAGYFDVFSTVLKRLSTSENVSDVTTGRLNLWFEYFNIFFSRPVKALFGNGINNGFTLSTPHNTIIDTLDLLGLVGTVIFYICLYLSVSSVWKTIDKKRRSFLPLIGILGTYMGLSMFFSIDFGFELFLAFGFLVPLVHKEEPAAAENEVDGTEQSISTENANKDINSINREINEEY